MALNDDIVDALVSHQVGLLRLSNATIRKIKRLLGRADPRIVERLLREDASALSKKRQEELLRSLRKIVDSVYEDATGALRIDLEGLAEYEGQYNLDMFRRVVPVRLDYVTPSAEQLIAAVNSRPFQGKILKDWYRDLPDRAFSRLRDSIRQGFVEGRTVQQMATDIRGRGANGFRDGILEINRRDAETTVRTAVNHTANAARAELYKRNEGLIKGVQWVSVLDSRTTAICMARDGNVYKVDKGPRPPAHPNCRSTTAPVMKSFRELGLNVDDAPKAARASMNGQVAGDLTYNDWLKKQPADLQDDVLGKQKARLFRKGGLSVDRFVDRKGREYTLDQLKRREADAWEKAGLAA